MIFTGSGGKSFQFFIGGALKLTTNSNSGPASANFNPANFGGVADGDQVTVKVYNKILDGGNPDPTACSSISSPVTVSIDPIPNASISSDKLNNIICDDESFKITATAGGITGASYEFSINGVFTDIVTATSTETSVEFSPTPPFTNSILVSVKVTTPSGCSSTTSLTMIENIISSAGTISGTQSVCFNEQPAEITGVTTATALSGSATITYQWQSSPNADFSANVDTIGGADNENYTPLPLTETTYFRRLAISNLNGKTCTSTTDIVEVEVKDGPGGQLLLNGSIVVSDTLCPDENLVLSITGIADPANKSFEYRRGGVVINTSSSTIFTVPNPSGTANYSAYVYDMPLLAGNIDPAACRSLTNSIVIAIADEEIVNLAVTGAISNTYCSGDNVVFTVTSPVGTNYEFKLNNQPLQNGASNTTSSTNITNNSIVSVIVTLADGCTASTSVTLIENTIDSPGTITGTQSICFNGQPTQLSNATTASATNASATITYQWQSSPNADFSADVDTIGGADNENYTPLPLTETTYFRRLAISNLNGKTCTSTTDIVEVEVKDGPGGQLLLNGSNVVSDTLCPDENLVLSITGIADAANKSFEYRRGGVVINTSSSTIFTVPNPSGTANYSAYVYDMPLLAGNIDPAACRSLTNSVTVIVLNEVNVNLAVTGAISNTYCSGDNVVFTVASPVGTNYEFKLNNQPLQNGASNTTSSTNITNNSVVSVIVTLANGCTASTSVTLIENTIDSPGTITGTQSICFNGQPTQLSNATTASATNASATITYQWQSSPNADFSADVDTIGGADNENYTPLPLTETTYFRRLAISNLNGKTCTSTTDIVEVEVKDGPGGQLLLNGSNVVSDTLCPDENLVLSITGIADQPINHLNTEEVVL